MVWVNIIRALRIACFKRIYPNIPRSSRVRGIRLMNKSYFSVINKSTVASCLEARKKACLFMVFPSYTFPIVIPIIIQTVSEFIVSLTVTLHTTYLARQEVDICHYM